MSILVPPIKCQGIKTKLIPAIRSVVGEDVAGRWIEPFCGSGVVALNLRPRRALLADTNQHIIGLYRALQSGEITPGIVHRHLESEGEKLLARGESHFYAVRDRFNQEGSPLDFLFLNRSCFNGVMRFNRKGGFNTPFCRKPNRFAPAYITKIVNQVRAAQQVIRQNEWTFEVADFRRTLAQAAAGDLVYADPPYLGRHADYFNGWSPEDDAELTRLLKRLPCTFVISTREENEFRRNAAIDAEWGDEGIHRLAIEHFYHVGSSEELRHGMTEALITNALPHQAYIKPEKPAQFALEFV